MAIDVIGEAPQANAFDEAKKWNDKYNLYAYLKIDSTLVSDSIVQEFKDSVANANMGELEKGEVFISTLETADSTALADKEAELAALTPTNEVEEKLRDMQLMILQEAAETNGYTVAEVQTLQSLASECPDEKGAGVIKARIILAGIEGPNKRYYNSCELMSGVDASSQRIAHFEKVQNNVFVQGDVYPNPAQNELLCKIESSINFEANLLLFDLMGKRIANFKTVNGINKFTLTSIASGVYYFKIISNNDIFSQGKLIVAK